MSLLLIYFDSGRAVVCSDGKQVRILSDGSLETVPGSVPKYLGAGRFVLGACGQGDVTIPLMLNTGRIVEANPSMTLRDVIGLYQSIARDLWIRRQRNESCPAICDAMGAAIIGVNESVGDMQVTLFHSADRFAACEWIPKCGRERLITALGDRPGDRPILQKLTDRMGEADKQHMPWIAAELRAAMMQIHERRPMEVGEPLFSDALNMTGWVRVDEFRQRAPIPASAQSCHHIYFDDPAEVGGTVTYNATTNKETAFAGTNRFFAGSILLPKQGFPDTVGNGDGGNSAQYGQLTRHVLPFATFQTIANQGNGTKTGEANVVNGNFSTSTFETLQVTGNGAVNVTQTSTNPVRPASIVQLRGPASAAVLYAVPTNSLNGGLGGNARFIIDIVYLDQNGTTVHNTVVTLGGGQTAPLSEASVSLPAGWQSVEVNITAETVNADTSGTLTAKIYQFYVDTYE